MKEEVRKFCETNLFVLVDMNFLDDYLKYLGNKNKKANPFCNELALNSGPTWTRTRDHLIMSQVL